MHPGLFFILYVNRVNPPPAKISKVTHPTYDGAAAYRGSWTLWPHASLPALSVPLCSSYTGLWSCYRTSRLSPPRLGCSPGSSLGWILLVIPVYVKRHLLSKVFHVHQFQVTTPLTHCQFATVSHLSFSRQSPLPKMTSSINVSGG